MADVRKYCYNQFAIYTVELRY